MNGSAMVNRRHLLAGAVLLATSAAILRAWVQAPLEADPPDPSRVTPSRLGLHADAQAAAAKAGPLPL
jgi:Fe-Mn family superoxide dismutase